MQNLLNTISCKQKINALLYLIKLKGREALTYPTDNFTEMIKKVIDIKGYRIFT